MGRKTVFKDSWYNGYSWNERYAKLVALLHQVKLGSVPPATGPCQLCRDPEVPVEYHDEDYSLPYDYGPTALYSLCRTCHRDKLHRRFSRPSAWKAFVAHVRRGGYARDLKDPDIREEVLNCEAAFERGESFTLRGLRPYAPVPGTEWFSKVRLDRESLNDPGARPRP